MQHQQQRINFVQQFLSDLDTLLIQNPANRSYNSKQASSSYRSDAANFSGRRVHVGINCASCGEKNIEGDRYNCTVCNSYDLCSKCFCAGRFNKRHIPRHPCLCIVRPIGVNDQARFRKESRLDVLVQTYSYIQNPNTVCKAVGPYGHPLQGIRIKCDSCYDYNMCYDHWLLEMHDEYHPMLIFFSSDSLAQVPFQLIRIIQKIGSGSFGEIFKACVSHEQNLVAVKVSAASVGRGSVVMINGEKISSETSMQSITNELDAHREIRSAFLCKLFGYSWLNDRICLIMEFMEMGSLIDVIQRETQGIYEIPLLRKLRIAGDIASGLYDIHKKNFIHADLKPDNVLIDHNFTAKISDLGIIKNTNHQKNYNPIGSVLYLPNEFFNSLNYTNRVDVFSYGLVLYYLFTRSFHQWSQSMPGPERYLLTPHLPLIRLEFIRDVVLIAANYDPNRRRDIFFYKWLFRKYCSKAELILNRKRDYKRAESTSEKDEILIETSPSILASVVDESKRERKLESEFVDMGISYNDLNNSNFASQIRYVTPNLSTGTPVKDDTGCVIQ